MKNIALLVLSIILLSSCDSLKVMSDYDKTVDFTQFKTAKFYGWEENTDELVNRFDRERIENAFREEFEARNVTFVNDEKTDLIVSLYLVTEDKVDRSSYTTGVGGGYGGYGYGGYYGYGPGYGWGSGYSMTTVTETEYKVGSLVVSVFDAKDEKLIWQSLGQGTIDENPKNREYTIPKAVRYIMKEYPIFKVK